MLWVSPREVPHEALLFLGSVLGLPQGFVLQMVLCTADGEQDIVLDMGGLFDLG